MLDNQLLALVASQIQAAIDVGNWGIDMEVMQKAQPTQEGIPTQPTVFFEKLFDEEYGWAAAKDTYDGTVFKATERQFVGTHIQISALVIQDPMDTSRPTASDVANLVRQYFSSRVFRAVLKTYGANTLRINDVSNPYFEDDRHRMEAFPSFDVVITHDRTISFDMGAITSLKEILFVGV